MKDWARWIWIRDLDGFFSLIDVAKIFTIKNSSTYMFCWCDAYCWTLNTDDKLLSTFSAWAVGSSISYGECWGWGNQHNFCWQWKIIWLNGSVKRSWVTHVMPFVDIAVVSRFCICTDSMLCVVEYRSLSHEQQLQRLFKHKEESRIGQTLDATKPQS